MSNSRSNTCRVPTMDGQQPKREERLLVLAPTARDADLSRRILAEAGIECTICCDLDDACREIEAGAAAVLLPEESLASDQAKCLSGMLARQPRWSDLPILVLTRGGADSPLAARALEMLGNVMLLERPLRVAELVSAVRMALRGRRRQYEIREHLVQLRRLAVELTQTEQRERQRLAATLHDHLQQLLVAAKMSLNMLRCRPGEEEQRQCIDQIEELLNESLAVSRSLTVELSPPILHEAGLTAALEWLARWMREKHGLTVDVQADRRADPADHDARILLFLAVRELLFNVVKHAGVHRARVEMRPAEGGGQVQIMVSDQGTGLDPASLNGRGDGTGGFGLLSIAERLTFLGGRLKIDSAPGRGTRVTVTAPHDVRRWKAVDGDFPQVGPADDAGTGPDVSPPAHKIRVVLADDHRILRQGLAVLLRSQPDIDLVAEASDGEMAVDIARRMRPDVVVMDVTMPRMNGIEATRVITHELPDVRVIGLSMHEHEEMADQMFAAGAASYVTKGRASEELCRAIRGETLAVRS